MVGKIKYKIGGLKLSHSRPTARYNNWEKMELGKGCVVSETGRRPELDPNKCVLFTFWTTSETIPQKNNGPHK